MSLTGEDTENTELKIDLTIKRLLMSVTGEGTSNTTQDTNLTSGSEGHGS